MYDKKIAILGSTGSIGKNLIDIIRFEKHKYKILLLSANQNLELLIHQAKEFNVKNIIITDSKKFIIALKKYKKLDINIYNSFNSINDIFKKKELDYSMISVVGIDGLKPSIDLIKFTKNIAIANKESIITGWNFIKRELNKYNTNFIPIDSEHFSIFSLIMNNKSPIDKVYITASGGPFLKKNIKNMKKINLKDTLKHPNWKMGKKISIDSSTMMNKVFEVVEAKKIFNLNFSNIQILTHPKSYLHAIVSFKNGLIKLLIHEPDMRIPIYNSLQNNKNLNYNLKFKKFFSKKIKLEILNNLELKNVNLKKFPLVNILKYFINKNTLYETVILAVNDFFVNKYLKKEINYHDMVKSIHKYSKNKDFLKYRSITPKKISQIYSTRDYVYSKLIKLSV